MADDYFDAKLALNPDSGNIVPGAVAQVYAITDTAFASPLDITDLTGVPLTQLVASPTGIYPPFRVVTGQKDVLVKSGAMITPVTSKEGARGEPGQDGEPGPPGPGVDPSGSVAGQVFTSQGPNLPPAWQSVNSGIAGAPTQWPQTFAPSAHSHTPTEIQGSTPLGRTLLSAADQQAARAAIGAGTGNGTSNLTLGTSATQAAPGNHAHEASQIPFQPTGSITATDVQTAIAQAALTGSGGGGGTSDTLTVKYASGAYPTQPSSPPAGVTVRHFYGPTRYMGPTWPGVLDLYTYAELT